MTVLLITMRILHVLTGVFWAGGVFYINSFMGPSIGAVGPDGLKVMAELRRRRHFQKLLLVGAVTILSGFVLVWIDSTGFDPAWFRTGLGMGISTGMLAAMIAWLVAFFVIKPATEATSALGMQMAQAASAEARAELAPRFEAARGRSMRSSMIGSALLLIAVLSMAVARYL